MNVICSPIGINRVPLYIIVNERLAESKFELMTPKPSPACDLKVASDSNPIIDSELRVTGRICSLTVYQAGTCSDMIPVWGSRD